MARQSYRLLSSSSVVLATIFVVCAIPARVAGLQQVPVFRGGVDLVNVGVTVTDRKSNLVTELTADDFEVYEDGKKQTARYFSVGLTAGPQPVPLRASAPRLLGRHEEKEIVMT